MTMGRRKNPDALRQELSNRLAGMVASEKARMEQEDMEREEMAREDMERDD
jgi:hypothetical protein